jgi:hypothetical protein
VAIIQGEICAGWLRLPCLLRAVVARFKIEKKISPEAQMLLLSLLTFSQVALAQDVGSITVTVSSGPNGKILVDGKDTGLTTPATVPNVTAGNHLVQVQVPERCLGGVTSVDVAPSREARAELNLSTQGGFTQIKVTPETASVLIDDKMVAMPFADELTCGKHKLQVTAPGFVPETREVFVEMGSAPTFRFELLEEGFGAIVVQVTPPNSKVLLDGKPVATGSETLNNIPSGDHVVRAELDGYNPAEQPVTVRANGSTQLNLALTPMSGGAGPGDTTKPPKEPKPGMGKKVAGGAVLAVGLGVGGVGAAMYSGARATYLNTYSPAYTEGNCGPDSSGPANPEQCEEAQTIYDDQIAGPYRAGIGLMVAGGALVASGGVLLFVSDDQAMIGYTREF